MDKLTHTSPVITILIPCRDASSYLDACLSSIQRQTMTDYECIIIDDHSTDDSPSIIKRWCRKDPRYRSLSNKGRGIIHALRYGLSEADGRYITRMDADDIMLPDKVEALYHIARTSPTVVAAGQVQYFSDTTLGDGYRRYEHWLNTNLLSADPWSDVYKECVVPSPAWMVQRSALDRIGAFDSDTYPEDYDLCLRMYKCGLQIQPTTEVVHLWRDYPTRTSRTDATYADNRFAELKVKYYVSIDLKADTDVILWGAGKRGKHIARLLSDVNVTYKWVSNNHKKIGKDIYGQQIMDCSNLAISPSTSIIVAVAGPQQQGIIDTIKESNTDIAERQIRCFC